MGPVFGLSAQLSAPYYFAGQFVYLHVTVRADCFFVLEANLHGVSRKDSRWVPAEMRVGERAGGRVAELGFTDATLVVECAEATVLGCEVHTEDVQEHQYLFYCELPAELPPSFNGRAFKFNYFVSLAAKVGQAHHKLLRVPFRVLRKSRVEGIDLEQPLMEPLKLGRAADSVATLRHPDDVFGFVELEDEVARGRVLLAQAQDAEPDPVEWALALPPHHCPLHREQDFVGHSNEKRATRFFDKVFSLKKAFRIQSKQWVVAEWHLDHSVVFMGDPMRGRFDFGVGQVRCHSMHVSLQRREIVRDGNGAVVHRIDHVVDELQQDVLNAGTIPICLYFPDHHAQTFSGRHMAVRWILKFIFLCARQAIDEEHDEELYHLAANVSSDELDKIEWELDVPVVVGHEMPRNLCQTPKVFSVSV